MSELVKATDGHTLVELDEAKRHIAIARSMAMAEELHEWRDRAAAMAHYAKMRGDSQEAANQAAEIKVRAEAALGALDAEARPAKVNADKRASVLGTDAPELGVSTKTRANWRKLGALDDKKLDQVIEEVKATDDTISTAAVVKVVEKQVKADKEQSLAAQAERFAQQRAAEKASLTLSEQVATAQAVAEITNYAPTARFVSALSMLAAQSVEQSKTLPEVSADEKGIALLEKAASDYELTAKAIRTFIGGN